MTWQDVIDKLEEWRRDPNGLAEDDLIPLTEAAIYEAIRFSREGDRQADLPPVRVVPDGDGGINFEFRYRSIHVRLVEIDRTGRAETVWLRRGKALGREAVN